MYEFVYLNFFFFSKSFRRKKFDYFKSSLLISDQTVGKNTAKDALYVGKKRKTSETFYKEKRYPRHYFWNALSSYWWIQWN